MVRVTCQNGGGGASWVGVFLRATPIFQPLLGGFDIQVRRQDNYRELVAKRQTLQAMGAFVNSVTAAARELTILSLLRGAHMDSPPMSDPPTSPRKFTKLSCLLVR